MELAARGEKLQQFKEKLRDFQSCEVVESFAYYSKTSINTRTPYGTDLNCNRDNFALPFP